MLCVLDSIQRRLGKSPLSEKFTYVEDKSTRKKEYYYPDMTDIDKY